MPRAPPGIVTAYQQSALKEEILQTMLQNYFSVFFQWDTCQKAGGGECPRKSGETACPDHKNKPAASNGDGGGERSLEQDGVCDGSLLSTVFEASHRIYF